MYQISTKSHIDYSWANQGPQTQHNVRESLYKSKTKLWYLQVRRRQRQLMALRRQLVMSDCNSALVMGHHRSILLPLYILNLHATEGCVLSMTLLENYTTCWNPLPSVAGSLPTGSCSHFLFRQPFLYPAAALCADGVKEGSDLLVSHPPAHTHTHTRTLTHSHTYIQKRMW